MLFSFLICYKFAWCSQFSDPVPVFAEGGTKTLWPVLADPWISSTSQSGIFKNTFIIATFDGDGHHDDHVDDDADVDVDDDDADDDDDDVDVDDDDDADVDDDNVDVDVDVDDRFPNFCSLWIFEF